MLGTPENLAVIFVEEGSGSPKETVANPVVLMVAAFVFDESHVTEVVNTCGGPLVNVPVAVNCLVVSPSAREIVAGSGVTAIDTSTGGVTVSVALLLDVTLKRLAVIVVVPCATDVASPFVLILMLATPDCDEIHVTADVKSSMLPSEYVPLALYC